MRDRNADPVASPYAAARRAGKPLRSRPGTETPGRRLESSPGAFPRIEWSGGGAIY